MEHDARSVARRRFEREIDARATRTLEHDLQTVAARLFARIETAAVVANFVPRLPSVREATVARVSRRRA